jgi:hypothetical protein
MSAMTGKWQLMIAISRQAPAYDTHMLAGPLQPLERITLGGGRL